MNTKIYKNGKYHRDMLDMNPETDYYGNKRWFDSNGKYHREDVPAIEYKSGSKFWLGGYHREDGPAIEWPSGYKEYWLEHINYTEEEYCEKIKELKKCKLFKLEDKNIGWI